ncbi:hypothetical protein EV360DRAFT_69115 [Lentinula raphanica]|nr:hypothetical protein EV360DRAFT_69115 [Lentinula raphanica]
MDSEPERYHRQTHHKAAYLRLRTEPRTEENGTPEVPNGVTCIGKAAMPQHKQLEKHLRTVTRDEYLPQPMRSTMRKKEEHNLVRQVALCKNTNLGAENVDQASLLGLQPIETHRTTTMTSTGRQLNIEHTSTSGANREGSYNVEDDTTEPLHCIFENTSSETCCLTRYREDLRGNSNIYTPEAEEHVASPSKGGLATSLQGGLITTGSNQIRQNYTGEQRSACRQSCNSDARYAKRQNVDDENDVLLDRGGRDQKAELAGLAGDRPLGLGQILFSRSQICSLSGKNDKSFIIHAIYDKSDTVKNHEGSNPKVSH